MNLIDAGWDTFFEVHFKPYALDGFSVGRIAVEHKNVYVLFTEYGELRAKVSGKIRYEASNRSDFPVVGDWVVIKPRFAEKYATIHAILTRKSKLSRKTAGIETEEQILAANIDTAFWISSFNKILNIRRIERYLTTVWESGAQPVIILNKLDLCTDSELEETVIEVESAAPGVPVHAVSAKNGHGIENLMPYMQKGNTIVFLGLSGVGKSTLINRLIGEDVQKVSEIRKIDDLGRHTTASRQLIILAGGGLVIDTPGIRELQLWDSKDGFTETFEEIENIAQHCRFSDCRHESEPSCAVKQAVEDGRIDPKRFQNYNKMQKELDHLNTKRNVRSKIVEKKRAKQFARLVKNMKENFKKHKFNKQ